MSELDIPTSGPIPMSIFPRQTVPLSVNIPASTPLETPSASPAEMQMGGMTVIPPSPTDYNGLINHPQIEGHELVGNVTLDELGLGDANLVIIPTGRVDPASTSTVFKATVPNLTKLVPGVCCYLTNGVITSASGFTLNVNNLGALPVYQNLAAATRVTTLFNVNYTMLFIYNASRVEGGCWDMYYGYNSDTNTIAYNIRRNQADAVLLNTLYRYEICFTNFAGQLIPANTVSNKPSTLTKALTTESFNPFGPIIYYSTTTTITAGNAMSSSYAYTQHASADLRYAFNKGTSLVVQKPVYIQCVPQTDGSVKLSGNDCLVQDLPNTEDGYVYIYLGRAYSTSQAEIDANHPIYYFKNGAIRPWWNAA